MPKDVKFESEIALNLMKLDNKTVVHVVDLQKKFLSALFLGVKSLTDV